MRHVSSDATRRYNYYYNKEGSEEVSSYDVTVKYIDVTDNSEVIYVDSHCQCRGYTEYFCSWRIQR